MESFEKEFSEEAKEKLLKDIEENMRRFEQLVKETKEEKKTVNKNVLKAKNLPLTCINKCGDCGNDFEAKISITSTCKECHNDFNRKVEQKLNDAALNNPYFKKDWLDKIAAMLEVSEDKIKNKAKT
jgi:hypothetical protein